MHSTFNLEAAVRQGDLCLFFSKAFWEKGFIKIKLVTLFICLFWRNKAKVKKKKSSGWNSLIKLPASASRLLRFKSWATTRSS